MQIYRIYFSENDSAQLIGRETPKSLVEEVDFDKVVVDKPWGYEYLMYRNPFSQVWSLFIKHNGITSMHCHPRKKTALIVLEGQAVFSTLNTSIHLELYDSVVIDSGVFHSTRAVAAGGVRIFEVETPPLKYDLIRLMDEYGRAGTFYEGQDKMRMGGNECVRFPELTSSGHEEKRFFNSDICILKIRGSYTNVDLQLLNRYAMIVILEGIIHSRKGQLLHSVSDVVACSDYINNLNSHVLSDLTLLLIKNKAEPSCSIDETL